MAFIPLIIGLALLAWSAEEAWWLHALIYTDKGRRMYQAKRQWLLIDFGADEFVKTELNFGYYLRCRRSNCGSRYVHSLTMNIPMT